MELDAKLAVTERSTFAVLGRLFSVLLAVSAACTTARAATSFVDTAEADFEAGTLNGIDTTTSPGDVTLAPKLDQSNTAGTTTGTGFGTPAWTGQTFIPAVSGNLKKVDVQLFANGAGSNPPNLTVSIRATSAGLPTGADLATGTIAGSIFGDAATHWVTVTFASPATVTAGTKYAVILRPVSVPAGSGYFWIRSSPSTYANGSRVLSADSGSTWSADTTRDYNFRTYVDTGSGALISSTKDANPTGGATPKWQLLSWTASTPANTAVSFQLAASNNAAGPFNFVGPDGTATTFFTTSSTSLSQFDGNRYLRYEAFLATSISNLTPVLQDVTITVVAAPTISVTTNPTNQTVNASQQATFTAAANANPGAMVQWQLSTDSGVNFNDISSATSTTMTFTTTVADDGNQYRAVFTNTGDNSVTATTTAATLAVRFVTVISPNNQTVNAGQQATFTAVANANPGATVQWQFSTDGGVNFNDILGATSTTLSFTAAASNNSNQYRAVFTNTGDNSVTATTTAATLAVRFVTVTNPTNQTVNATQQATFTASANANPGATVQWQLSTDGGVNFNDIFGATSTSLSFTAAASNNGNQYRAVFTNAGDNSVTATTTAATLAVRFVTVISPNNQTVNAGQQATFIAAANANPGATVQWQLSTDGGVNYNDIPGATSTTLSFTAVASNNGNQYRAVFTNAGDNSVTSTTTAATLTVVSSHAPLPVVSLQPSSSSIFAGQMVTLNVSASGTGLSYQWYQGNSDDTSASVAGATSASFTTPPLTASTNYWVMVSNSAGRVNSNTAVVTVFSQPVFNGGSGNTLVNATMQLSVNVLASSGTSVNWSFGDGSTATGVKVSHQYTMPGAYSVIVTVTDASGQNSSVTQTVTVAPTPFRLKKALFNLKSGNDSATISGIIHIPAGLTLAQTPFIVTVGGNVVTFNFSHGKRATSGASSFALAARTTNGVTVSSESKFSLNLTGNLGANFKANAPLDANGLPTQIGIQIQFSDVYIGLMQSTVFTTEKKGQTASGKLVQ